MDDYKKLVDRLRDEPKDSRKAVLSIYDLCIDAAYAIEILLDKLKYAEGERDVVTKRMIEMEEQNAELRRQIDNLTSAQSVMVKEFEGKMEELSEVKEERNVAISALDEALSMCDPECIDPANSPCGHRQWCDCCDAGVEHNCAMAYMEWRDQKKEA